MRVVLQRVSEASVSVNEKVISHIGPGLLIFLGVSPEDSEDDLAWLIKKITQLRIFEDESGKMNQSLLDASGEVLVVSQFTLYASTKKGNRPSFTRAAPPQIAEPFYEQFCSEFEKCLSTPVARGQFGADMDIALINDGPVTLILDSKNRELF